jgi:hypothetical protein
LQKRKPERARQAEGMEERQDADEAVFGLHRKDLRQRIDIGERLPKCANSMGSSAR